MFKYIIAPAVVIVLSLALGIGTADARGQQPAKEPPPGPDVAGDVARGMPWKELPEGEITQVLQVLASFTRSNFEKISTWRGSYSVHLEEYLSENFVREAFGDRVPKNSTRSLIQERDAVFDFAIQMNPEACFRSWNTERFRLLTTDARRESVVVPGVQPDDRTSIFTNDNYIYFSPKDPPATYAVLPKHPEAQNKRAARRVPIKNAMNKPYSELIDPRFFYRCSMPCMMWEEMNIYIESINGQRGEEKQRLAKEGLRVDSATHGGRTWYRIRVPIRFPGGTVRFVTSVWSPSVGFNPILLTFSSKPAGEGWVFKSVVWDWKLIDGIFAPSYINEVWKPEVSSDAGTYVRRVSLKDCSLNASIPPSKFSITALGLRPGELILDEVDQAVFVVGEDGGTKRLAGFHEPYVPPGASRTMGPKRWFLAGNGLLAAAFVAWILRGRGNSSRPPIANREASQT